jgi:hypothetical protein
MRPYRVDDVLAGLPDHGGRRLPVPAYAPARQGTGGLRLGLAVKDMSNHMTDEGWQLFLGLAGAGYTLAGHGLALARTSVPDILSSVSNDWAWPEVVVLQDKREWDVKPGNFRDRQARFTGVQHLESRHDLFKLTVLKDAQQNPGYHEESASEIGCHAWVIYYHPQIVHRLAPYTRPEHMVRTTHSLDPTQVPAYSYHPLTRTGCLLSGAVSGAYPLRRRLVRAAQHLYNTTVLPHPGYHRAGCATPGYLQTLAKYRVAICTASRYGYALRKLIEATAAGCVVVTDLPVDDQMAEIDPNLVRVHPDIDLNGLNKLLRRLHDDYDPARQQHYAERAAAWYDYRAVGRRLAADIEHLRLNYDPPSTY